MSVTYGRDKVMMDALLVAYYLSRANRDGLERLGYDSFKEAYNDLGSILHRKPATIKNMRDDFDPYFDNDRVGWYQRPLRPSRQEIFDQYADTSVDDLTEIVKNMLKPYRAAADEEDAG